jgi:beta-lactamase class A
MIKKITAILIPLMFATTIAMAAASSLEKEINSDLKGFSGKIGVYAKNLNTGKTFKFNQDDVFPTASTSKLVVALATYKYLYPKAEADRKVRYDQTINLMITISDNASFEELLGEFDVYKRNALDMVIKDLHLNKTKIHNEQAFQKYQYHSVTTSYEMAKVFETIYTNKYLEKEKNERLKYELANTIFRDEIPRYMLTPVFHKVGELDDVLCDVGVVQDGHDPILISIYTTSTDHNYSSAFIANESAKLYNALRKH